MLAIVESPSISRCKYERNLLLLDDKMDIFILCKLSREWFFRRNFDRGLLASSSGGNRLVENLYFLILCNSNFLRSGYKIHSVYESTQPRTIIDRGKITENFFLCSCTYIMCVWCVDTGKYVM